MPRGRVSSAVSESAWLWTACYRDPASQAVRDRWQEAWREEVAGDRLGSADLETTYNLLWGGWHLAVHEGRYRDAADLFASYFAHPDITGADWSDVHSARHWLAYSLLEAGDEAEALAHLRLLVEEPTHRRNALREAKITLLNFLHDKDHTTIASEALTEVVQEIVHRMKRRNVRRWVRDSKSYDELLQLLHSTVPMKERQRVIPEALLLG